MYDIPTYNHPEKKEPTEEKPSLFHKAAKFSLYAPIVGGIFVRSLIYGLKGSGGAALILALGGLIVLLYLASFGLGVFALFGLFRYGARGILIRAVLGIVLSGTLLGCFGVGFVHGFQTALKKQQEMMVRARTATDNTGKETATSNDSGDVNVPEGGVTKAAPTNAPAEKLMANYQQTTPGTKAPATGPVDRAAVTNALYIQDAKRNTLMAAYDAAALALKTPSVLSMKDVTQQEQLLAKKELVNKFLDANEKLLGFTTKAETSVRAELAKLHASPATLEGGLKEYRQQTGDRDYITMQMRATDQRIGTAMLTMLNVLNTSWGNWKYDAEKNKLAFQDGDAAARYTEGFNEMNAATAEKTQLQAQLTRATTTASTETKPSI